VQLKDVLGEIQSDGAHLVHGRLLEWPATPSLWHTTAAGGVHTVTAIRGELHRDNAALAYDRVGEEARPIPVLPNTVSVNQFVTP
jgi:hypothetical protein